MIIGHLKETLDRELSSMKKLDRNPRLELVKDILLFHRKCMDEEGRVMYGVKQLYIQQTNVFWSAASQIIDLSFPTKEMVMLAKHFATNRKKFLDFELAFALFTFHGRYVNYVKLPSFPAIGEPVQHLQKFLGDGKYYKLVIGKFRPLEILDTAYYSEDEV